MSAYYNEHDKFAAAWLRELIKARLIADGDVDERDIQDVGASDVRGFTQCHFFAGIGGWSYALRLAGWPDDRLVWTGSCPCQGYSAAGKQQGAADARNLWPSWFRLIGECQPVTIFGEQVANATGHDWLDAVSTDLEGINYALGAVVLGAHSVGAPHRRQRLWFVADTPDTRRKDRWRSGSSERGISGESEQFCAAGLVADADGERRTRESVLLQRPDTGRRDAADRAEVPWCRAVSDMGDTIGVGLRNGGRAEQPVIDQPSHWALCEWIACRDGKSRPAQPGIFPLAHGVSGRVGRLRGYGNAIVAQVAAEVIAAYMELR